MKNSNVRRSKALTKPFPPGWEKEYEEDGPHRRLRATRRNLTSKKAEQSGKHGRDVITQTELRELQEQILFAQEVDQKRKAIRHRAIAGAVIEPGEIKLDLEKTTSRSFSYKKIADVIGTQAADELRDQIRPTEKICMKISN
jgi:hypothetical protein